jgi:glycosyltransferase involved in cell wall biosynthesis
MAIKSKSITVIIPVYNSEQILPSLFLKLIQTLESMECPFEIIFIEDCSKDNSWNVIELLSTKDSRVKGIQLSHNYGQHNALLSGIRAANHEIIVTIDDDLQNPPEEIPKLVQCLIQGNHDVVYGYPVNESRSFLRKQASVITKIALKNAMGIENARYVSSFRAFYTNIRDSFSHYQNTVVNIDVLLTWGASRFASIKVQHNTRHSGSSGYTLSKLMNHAFNMITGFTTFPLKMASYIGFIFSMFGFIILCYVLFNYLFHGKSIAGFTFLASSIALLSGAQLLTLGIMGEYLARMNLRSMQKPAYHIKEKTK